MNTAWPALVTSAFYLFEGVAQIGLAVLIVSQAGPRRPRYLARVAGAVGILAVFCLLNEAAMAAFLAWAPQTARQAIAYMVVLVVFAGLILLCHDVTPLTALCYASAGYAAQNLVHCGYALAIVVGGFLGVELSFGSGPGYYLLLVAVYSGIYLLFARRARNRGFAEAADRATLLVAVLVVAVVIVYNLAVEYLTELAVEPAVLGTLRTVQVMMCSFIIFTEYELLYNRRLRAEAEAAERALADAARQYELSKEVVDAVNLKCHYIRRQIRGLRETESAGAGGTAGGIDPAELDALEQQVGAYDAAVHTGNEALDVILSQKRLQCEREGIEFTCIADGCALAALGPADLYALVGNALDGAIDASRGLPAGGRTISLTLRAARGLAALHVENRCASEVVLADGLPAAPPAGAKGGRPAGEPAARSMRLAAERLGGSVSFSAAGDILIVDVLLPLP